MVKICVVGAGVVGLSCAYKALEVYGHSLSLTIIADSFMENTTSYGSGGLWEPYQIKGTDDMKINEWGKISFDHFASLFTSNDAERAGIQLMTCYKLLEADEDHSLPAWKDIVVNFNVLHPDDLRKMGIPPRFTGGYSFGTFVVDQKYYLQFLTQRLMKHGAKFVKMKLKSLEDLRHQTGHKQLAYDAVINCAGLGSAELVGDNEMYPISGQVLRVRLELLRSSFILNDLVIDKD